MNPGILTDWWRIHAKGNFHRIWEGTYKNSSSFTVVLSLTVIIIYYEIGFSTSFTLVLHYSPLIHLWKLTSRQHLGTRNKKSSTSIVLFPFLFSFFFFLASNTENLNRSGTHKPWSLIFTYWISTITCAKTSPKLKETASLYGGAPKFISAPVLLLWLNFNTISQHFMLTDYSKRYYYVFPENYLAL